MKATASQKARTLIDLGPVSRIPMGEGRTFNVDDTTVAVFHTRSNEVVATQAQCPHRDGPLADGIIGEGQLICPLHAYKYDLRTGQPIGHDCGPLKTYSVSVSDEGNILLTIED